MVNPSGTGTVDVKRGGRGQVCGVVASGRCNGVARERD